MKFIFALLSMMMFFNVSMAGVIDKKPLVAFLDNLSQEYKKVENFSATMRLENFDPTYQLQKQKVWFKKPGYILLKQLGPFKEGAALSVKPNGEIEGHLGGFLSFAVVSVDKDDKNMYGVTGDTALNTDYDKIIRIAQSMIEDVIDYSISKNEKNQLVLDSKYQNKIDQYKLIVDPENMLIVGLERYSKNKLIHKIQWFDIAINKAISNEIFDL